MMIPLDQLIDRGLYRIRARNFFVGVWSATDEGFIGIRQKFDAAYLFTEYYRGPLNGTAIPIEDLGVLVPDEIELRERMPFACLDCGRPAEQFAGSLKFFPVQGPPYYRHLDDQSLLENDRAALPLNQSLFDWLKPYADAEDARWLTEVGPKPQLPKDT